MSGNVELTEKIVKAEAAITAGPDDDASEFGTFALVLSTPSSDRDGEEVKSDEWEQPLPDHITFDVDHGMSVASTVGSGTPTLDESGRLVVMDGRFASTDLAQTTRALVREKHIRTASVAFLRKSTKNAKSGDVTVRRELLNGAFVAVPANKEAMILTAKDLAEKAGARNSATDLADIQRAHDLIVGLGAVCSPSKSAQPEPTDAQTPDEAAKAVEPTDSPQVAPAGETQDETHTASATAAADEAAAAAHAAWVQSIHAAALRQITQATPDDDE